VKISEQLVAAAINGLCASIDGVTLDDAFVENVARRACDIAERAEQELKRRASMSAADVRNLFAGGKDWRLLRINEILKYGDQKEHIPLGWRDISLDMIGEKVTSLSNFRRRTDTEQPVEQTKTPASDRRTAGFSETGGCLVADLLTDDQQWAVLRAMNSLELKERGDGGPNDEELDNKAVSILCALVCQQQTSDAACVPHADKSLYRPDVPPDVTQPDNGLATSGRGPKTSIEERSMNQIIPQRGETVQYDRLGDGSWLTIHVGDGKTPIQDLPAIADYDLRERVINLEEEVAKLKRDLKDHKDLEIPKDPKDLVRM